MLRGIYLAIILDRYEGPQTPLNIALLRGLYLAIILDRYGGHQTALLQNCLGASTQLLN
jgi:hypothetical protein